MTVEASTARSRWRRVLWLSPALVVLALLASAYLAAGQATVLVPLVLLATLAAGVVSPLLGVVLVLLMAVLADALMAVWTGSVPVFGGDGRGWLAEVALMGGALGAALGLLRARRPTPMEFPIARLYLCVVGAILVGSLVSLAWDWGLRSPYLARVIWSALPDRDQGAPVYVLRSGLFLLLPAIWLPLVHASIGAATRPAVVWRAWVVGSLVLALYGIRMWIRGQGHPPPRVESLLDDVNSYGSYLVLTLFVSWAALLVERRRAGRWLAGAALAATLVMLLLSGSRAAMLAAMLGSVALVGGVVTTRRAAVASIVGFGLVFLLAVAALHTVPGEGPTVRVLREVSSPHFLLAHFRDNRQAVWSAAARAFLERPLVGLGPGTLYRRLGEFYASNDPGWRPEQENAHNYLLQLAAETGALGVAAFGLLLWSVLQPVLGRWHTSTPEARVLAIGALAYLLTCVSGHPLLIARQVILFWGYLALVAVVGGIGPRPDGVEPRAPRRAPLWPVVLIAALAFVASDWSQPCARPQMAKGSIGVAFGEGFGSSDPEGWRQMRKAGKIELCNGAAESRIVDVTMRIEPLDVARTLAVHVPGRPDQQLVVPDQGTDLRLRDIGLTKGRMAIILVESKRRGRAENLSPEVARRHLTVRAGRVEVSVRPP